MTLRTEIGDAQLADLVKQVQAGNEVLLTVRNQPVARIVPPGPITTAPAAKFHVRSIAGRRVLTPAISQKELAEELFGGQ